MFSFDKLYNDKLNYKLFLIYCLILLALSYLVNHNLLTRDFYFNSFVNTQKETVEQMLEIKQKWGWISYLVIPLKLIFKFTLVALVFKVGFIFNNIEVSYRKLINAAIVSEIVFITYSCVMTYFTLQIKSLDELQSIPTLSIYNIVSMNKVPNYLSYCFRNLNLIEFIYWLVLAFVLSRITKNKYIVMLKFVLLTYVPLLLVWLLITICISLFF
jgi:hypothetical protein